MWTSKCYGAFVIESSARRLLDGMAMPVLPRSTEPGRPRHRREHPTHWLITTQVPKPVTEREKKIPAGPLLLFDMCGLDTFIMTIGLTYMPIQPVASFLCFWYFWSRGRCGNQPHAIEQIS